MRVGGQRLFKQCLKKLHNWRWMASLSQNLIVSKQPWCQIPNLNISTIIDFYLHWGELVLVILRESRGRAVLQQCIVVEQHTDIVEYLHEWRV